MDGEVKERRRIQFSVPSGVPSQLDPRQVELIRRRRPTPATLFRLTDHPSPEEDGSHQQLAVCENGVLKPKKDNTATYQPPSLKAVQKMVQSHLQSPDISDAEDVSLDSARDDVISDQSDHQSACELTDEETDSAPLHEFLGGGDGGKPDSEGEQSRAESPGRGEIQVAQASMQCPEEGAVPSGTAETEEASVGCAGEPPDDTMPDQSDQRSAHEVTDRQSGSALLHQAPGGGDGGQADSARDGAESPAREECEEEEDLL
ncbi:uncharacterized protein LOC143510970 isoform X1 [Brachyhypopomus gauderio]|uniref:uncharacterized protein LOC143510970 isoform X1 n=1 Tax=Brachyhypopomus gauderio TaxID=698409 RepID=UPI0040418167